MKHPDRMGLIGHNIDYSLSPQIFKYLFELTGRKGGFELIDVSPDRFEEVLYKLREFCGFSVTVPYKQTVLSWLDHRSSEAIQIGAVNSVRVIAGELYGFNTDAEGFMAPLKPHLPMIKKVLILGNGGAARAVLWSLREIIPEADYVIAGRSKKRLQNFVIGLNNSHKSKIEMRLKTYKQIEENERFDIIVNTTPLGGVNFPNQIPLPEGFGFMGNPICYDLNYSPSSTLFLNRAQKAGCRIIGGLPMLVTQAILSYNIWTESNVSVTSVSHEIITVLKKRNQGVFL